MIRKSIVLLTLLLVGFAAKAEEPVEELGPDKWPTTVEATVDDLIERMPDSSKEKLEAMDEEGLALAHFGIGLHIRNYYGLWRGNDKLLRDACGGEACHPDDASGHIVKALWSKLRESG